MAQTYCESLAVNRPVWSSVAASTSPSARKHTADGIVKYAMRVAFSATRARTRSSASDACASAAIDGSAADEIEMPNRLTGSV